MEITPEDHVQFETEHVRVLTDAITGYDVVTMAKNPQGVVVVPRRSVRGITEFGFVRQYRHTARTETLEFPRGGVDPGETYAEGGIRELREETGYEVDPESGVLLGPLWPDSGILRSDIVALMYTVNSARPVSVEEDIQTTWLSVGEILGAIMRNKIVCGLTLGAWAKVTANAYDRMPY